MLSAVLAIAGAIVVIVALAYFATTYLPVITEFFNSIYDVFGAFTQLVPPWLLAFALVPLLLCVIGIIIKLL